MKRLDITTNREFVGNVICFIPSAGADAEKSPGGGASFEMSVAPEPAPWNHPCAIA